MFPDHTVAVTVRPVIVIIIFIVIIIVVILIRPIVSRSDILLYAAGTESGDAANVEAVVSAEALQLEIVLCRVRNSVVVDVDVACPAELPNGTADGGAGGRNVICVELEVGPGYQRAEAKKYVDQGGG